MVVLIFPVLLVFFPQMHLFLFNFKEPDSINDQNEISELDNTLDLLTRGTESRAATDFIDIDENDKNQGSDFSYTCVCIHTIFGFFV